MYILVEDSYDYYGRWLNGMMHIGEDGILVNIRRFGYGDSGIKHIANLANSFSTRDAFDEDIYWVDDESNLVYIMEEAKLVKQDGVNKLTDQKISLVFPEAAKHHIDKVVKRLKENGFIDVEHKVVKTFGISCEEAKELLPDDIDCGGEND